MVMWMDGWIVCVPLSIKVARVRRHTLTTITPILTRARVRVVVVFAKIYAHARSHLPTAATFALAPAYFHHHRLLHRRKRERSRYYLSDNNFSTAATTSSGSANMMRAVIPPPPPPPPQSAAALRCDGWLVG